jgi:uncharacterized protein YggE
LDICRLSRQSVSRIFGVLGFLCLAASLSSQVDAQDASAGIQTSGSAVIKVSPTKLRLSLTIRAEADEAKKSIKLLQDHKVKVRESLVNLKADEKSIHFSSTRLEQNDGFPPNYPNASVRARILQQANTRGVDPEDLPIIFVAKADLRVDWALPTTDPDAIALLISALREQAAEKDLEGKNIESEINDDLRDKVESLQQLAMQQGYYVDSSATGSSLTIQLVGEVTAEQQQAAVKEAYAEAVANAQNLANATAKTLGKVISLRENVSTVSVPAQAVQNAYGQVVYSAPMSLPDDKRSVVSNDIDSLRKTITVTVVHSLE